VKEYESILLKYQKDGYDMYSKTVPRAQWGNRTIAERYLEKYWIPNAGIKTRGKSFNNVYLPPQRSECLNWCSSLILKYS
jgi:hypothetical protein